MSGVTYSNENFFHIQKRKRQKKREKWRNKEQHKKTTFVAKTYLRVPPQKSCVEESDIHQVLVELNSWDGSHRDLSFNF